MRTAVANLAELAGICLITAGLWTIAPVLGLICAGIGCLLAGVAVDPPKRRSR